MEYVTYFLIQNKTGLKKDFDVTVTVFTKKKFNENYENDTKVFFQMIETQMLK